jgi:hypothetical protein
MSNIERTIEQFIQVCNSAGWTIRQNDLSNKEAKEAIEQGIKELEKQFGVSLSDEIKACYRYFSENDYIEHFGGYRIIGLQEEKERRLSIIEYMLEVNRELNVITEEEYQQESKNNYFYWPLFVNESGDDIFIHLLDSSIYHRTHDDGYGADIRGLVKHYSSLKNMLEILTVCVERDLLMDENGDWSKENQEAYIYLHREKEPNTPYWFEAFHLEYL